VPTDEYRREFSRRIGEIRIPGERDYCTRARLMREGIEIDVKIHDALRHLAEGNLDHGLS
jgi:L-2-hydroxycarboxylate dehydrogenase (NAD+)